VARTPLKIDAALDRPKSRNVAALGRLWPFMRPYRTTMIGASIALVSAASATLAIGQALRRVVDLGFSAENSGFIDQYFLAVMGIVGVLAVATFARYYAVSWLGERVVADLRTAVYARVVNMSPVFFETTPTPEVLSRLTSDTTLIESVVGSSASIALRNLLMFIGGSVLLAVTSPKLTLMVAVVLPLLVLPLVILGRRVRGLSRESQDRIAGVSSVAGETLNAVATVQAFTQEANEIHRFSDQVEKGFLTATRRISARAWLTALVILGVFGAIDVVLWSGAKDVVAGAMTGGQLAAFVFYAVVVAGALGSLSEVWGDVQRAAGAAERLLELLASEPLVKAPANPAHLPERVTGSVSFDKVTFHYPSRPDRAALDAFTLDIRAGETVALVGPSGAGKTTVFQLLLRYWDPEKGAVRLDGIRLADLDPLDIRRHMAIVPQDTVIFAADAMANIRYGRPDATDDEVRAAAEAAQASGFIEQLPDGYASFLGERGVRLSGGQRQRIAIARAILRDPAVLLLDEATSALDAESERAVQMALERLMANRTTLVVAHRLATVKKADRIVVLDAGGIVAIGSHDELVAAGGLYARLAALQFGAADATLVQVPA